MNAEVAGTMRPNEKLMSDLRLVMADAQELLRSTASQAGEEAVSARAKLQESLRAARGHISDAEAAVVEKARQAAHATDEYVHENPWKSVGAGFSVGIIIGMLIGRR